MGEREVTTGSRTVRAATDCERPLWGLVVLAMAVDVWLTWAGLRLGLHETNPVARHVLAVGGIGGLLALKSVCIGICASLRPVTPDAQQGLIPLGLSVPWVAAVLINAGLLLVVATS